jgi:hypothetical protein
LASPADAQRAKDNAVTAASDAFGTEVGNQTIGLYSPTNTRGFSPTQAENVRIERLYFDQQTSSSDPCLFSDSDMRVVISAQSYAFPSPSGIADLKLRTAGGSSPADISGARARARRLRARQLRACANWGRTHRDGTQTRLHITADVDIEKRAEAPVSSPKGDVVLGIEYEASLV